MLQRWIIDHIDLVGIFLAAVAILLSLMTAIINVRQKRRDSFLRVHELLSDPDQQEGRRLLYLFARCSEPPDLCSPEFASMNKAVTTLNAVALYVQRRIVPRRWFLDVWHHPLRDIAPAAEAFLTLRQRAQLDQSWRPGTHLHQLLDQARTYRTRMSCCRPADTHRHEDSSVRGSTDMAVAADDAPLDGVSSDSH